jgi:hypothetical protein
VAAARPETTGRKLRGYSHDQADRLVYTVPEAGRLLGLSRNASYEAARTRIHSATSCSQSFVGSGFPIIVEENDCGSLDFERLRNQRCKEKRHG